MTEKHAHAHETPCALTVQNLCDLLEVYMGKEAGTEACRKMIEHVKKCPTCCTELETLTKTIEVYRKVPEKDVPEDMQARLLSALNLNNSGLPGDIKIGPLNLGS